MMKTSVLFVRIVLALAFVVAMGSAWASSDGGTVRLMGHVPTQAVAQSVFSGAASATEQIPLVITLPLRNQSDLNKLLARVYDPKDPLYGHYLTPQEFISQFSPTQADYDAVIAYAKSVGLSVSGTHPNRTIVDVTGSAAVVQKAFGLRLNYYSGADGRAYRAPSANPAIPSSMAGRVSGVVGLDTLNVRTSHIRKLEQGDNALSAFGISTALGSGPNGGFSPHDIKAAYGLTSTTRTGAGQSLALFELDGYSASDITVYETMFNLPAVPLTNILVDGATGKAGSGSEEVVLDIELQIAMAPGAKQVLVYEGPNTDQGVIDTYNKIATDNIAKQISTSWGIYEAANSSNVRNAENAVFAQMALQGQSIYAAAGDAGAYDNDRTRCVDDPAAQPYVVGVGGTKLTVSGQGGTWVSETTWNAGSPTAGAGGGGSSSYWPIPSYQQGVITTTSKGSTTARNVPDVALNADPKTGYAIYASGTWSVFGGTSCAAPVWAGFTALVNEERVSNSKATLGFPNPAIYKLGATATSYAADFHDIADSSTNLYYPAVTGYDLATGWGSIKGVALLTALAGSSSTSGGSTGGGSGTVTAQQLIGNPGFENGPNSKPWYATSGVIDPSAQKPAHGGSWKAWLCGYGMRHTDVLYQDVTIPSNVTSATLSYYLRIDSAETASAANDTLVVQLRNSSNQVLTTLEQYSNINISNGFSLRSFNVLAYKGQTVRIYVTGTENGSRQTSFVMDDFALNVK